MDSLFDIFATINTYVEYLDANNFPFTDDGFPVFTKEMFLEEIPQMLIPVQHRKNRRVNKRTTVLVFYCSDDIIYRRLDKLLLEIDDYRQYLGVVEPDVTVTCDMDVEWQQAIMLLNQLAMAVLACNGIRVILNTRSGQLATRDMFRYIPKGIMVASGFRGGSKRYDERDMDYISKILRLLPHMVLIYGCCHGYVTEQLERMNIPYKVYPDFRSMCKKGM